MSQDQPQVEPFLTVEELAEKLGGNLKPKWLSNQALAGNIPSHKFGHYRRYVLSEVAEALREIAAQERN